MTDATEDRIRRLIGAFADHDIDAFLVLVPENRRYLSGFTGEDTQFDETAGGLFVSESRRILATDSRYALQAEKEAPLFEVFCYEKGLFEAVPELLRRLGTRRLGFESVRLSCLNHGKMREELDRAGLGVSLKGIEDLVESQRVVKDEKEIEATRRALAVAEAAFAETVASMGDGATEKDLAWALERRMREKGAEAASFPVIVASGPNSALPHAVPGDRQVAPGEPVLFDWGARLGGYCSDTSRTVVLGEADETFRKVFATVYEAQQRAIEAIRPGVGSRSVDGVARKLIEEAGFAGKFGHGLGHGTGLAIHENPRLSPLRDVTLEAGMVVTVEPGIYLPGWGGVRLENQVVIRPDGAEVLNGLPVAAEPEAYGAP
jgi:Xaa-Pro aminopeptidase